MLQLDREHEGSGALPDRGERALLAAVIQRAIDDVFVRPTFRRTAKPLTIAQKWNRRKVRQQWAKDRRTALRWLLDESGRQRVMSLDWCCDALDLNAATLRTKVRGRLHGRSTPE
jgi:hypothetical protein